MAAPNRDPRSEAEKARADLKRNAEMDMSLTESPTERRPSVTPDTFGVHDKPARQRSGAIEGVEAGGRVSERAPAGTRSRVETEQVSTGRDSTAPARRAEEDVLSRAKE
jgi:hypothetical protein